MSVRRRLAVSFVVQGGGAASVLLATLLLGAQLGPEVQGGFSRIKSEIEFIAAFAMFGLPQALFFYAKSGQLGMQAALRWVGGSALLAMPLGAIYALLQQGRTVGAALLLGVVVSVCVAHGQLRALLLVGERTLGFNVMTAAPQVLILLGAVAVIGGMLSASPVGWFAAFFVAYGLAAAMAWLRLRAGANDGAQQSVGWQALGHYGLAAWFTAALSTAAVLFMQRWVEQAQGSAALGQFTMALALVQVPLTPISYAAPLLFRHWMEQPAGRSPQRWSALLFLGLLLVSAVVGLLSLSWSTLGLGEAYEGATLVLAFLLVGGAAEAASRVLAVQANARGRPWINVRAECARWSVLAIGSAAGLPRGLLPLCALWSASACAAGLVVAWHGRTATGASQ